MRMVKVSSTTSCRPAACQACGKPPGKPIGRENDFARHSLAAASSIAAVSQNMRETRRPPRESQTVAATVPRGRVTRRISRTALGLRNELQDQERQRMIEGAVGKRQGAGIADLIINPSIAIVAFGMLDIDRRKIDALDAAYSGTLNEACRQAAGSATHVQDAVGGGDPGELDEQRREPSAPSPHLQLVPVAVRRNECG